MSIVMKIVRKHWALFGGSALAIVYWLIEDILHFAIFHGEGLRSELLPLEEANELWMRTITAVMFVAFGIVVDAVLMRLRLANQERGRLVEQLERRAHDLGERVKELSCLYGIDELAGREGVTLTEILEGTLGLISPACFLAIYCGSRSRGPVV